MRTKLYGGQVIVDDSRPAIGEIASKLDRGEPDAAKSQIQPEPGLVYALIESDEPKSLGIPSLPPSFYLRYGKRIIDIVVAGLVMLLLLPVYLGVAILVVLDDGAPVLYRQKRVGQFGRQFSFVKFRTMRRNADQMRGEVIKASGHTSPAFKMKADPRVTRVGKWLRRSSLDELPQVWDVLVGRMSIVGPRPHLPEEVRHYDADQWARLCVKPGLFCLREVSGRSELTFDQWMKMDIDYVRTQSFALDVAIMLKVIPAILSARGAY